MSSAEVTVPAGNPWGDGGTEFGELLDLVAQRPAFWALAACRVGPHKADFFPDRDGDVRPAKAICAACPVTASCLAWALAQGPQLVGVFGGTTPGQRAVLSGRRKVVARTVPTTKPPVVAVTPIASSHVPADESAGDHRPARAVVLAAADKPVPAIARRLGVNRATVTRWLDEGTPAFLLREAELH